MCVVYVVDPMQAILNPYRFDYFKTGARELNYRRFGFCVCIVINLYFIFFLFIPCVAAMQTRRLMQFSGIR
jgi:hypothetical protein